MDPDRQVRIARRAIALGLLFLTPGCVKHIETCGGYSHLRANLRVIGIAMLEEGAAMDSDRIVVLRGDAGSLERWLTRLYKSSEGKHWVFLAYRTAVLRVAADGSVQLRDPWEQRIAYECLDPATGYVARLYSFGPNRKDEGGAGDDICVTIRIPETWSARKIEYRDE